MTLETNGGRPSVRLTLPNLAYISSILGVFIYVAGFYTGYLTFKSEMSSLRETVNELRSNSTTTRESIGSLTVRLSTIETDIKYIGQGVAKLQIEAVPKR